jgi:hypothetical protein
MQESGAVNFTANSSNLNVGNIVTCTNVSEFITYQIDGQAPRIIATPAVINVNGALISSYQPNSPTASVHFTIEGVSILATGTTTSGFVIWFPDNANVVKNFQIGTSPGANISVNINSTGPVGSYIDFTFGGSYTDGGVVHTISGTGHVKRKQ